MKASDIDYINTHGTSTPLGDVSEVKGQAVTKSELDTKNQGLQNQFQRVYDSQAKLNEKLSEIEMTFRKSK